MIDLGKINYSLLSLMMMAFIGGILFFPVNIKNKYSCLYHYYFSPSSNEVIIFNLSDSAGVVEQENIENMSSLDESKCEYIQSRLLTDYLVPYGILWWLSLGVLVVVIYLSRMKQSINRHNLMPRRLNKDKLHEGEQTK